MLPVEYQLQNKELVKQWVEALRSGKYRQTTSRLRKKLENGYGHCCLGVLCEVIKPLIPELDLLSLEENLENGAYPSYTALKHLLTNYLGHQPISVQMPDNRLCAVYTLNDELQMSFNEIADLLEQTHLKEAQNVSTNDETSI